jgi:anti-sigma B factor antagonist
MANSLSFEISTVFEGAHGSVPVVVVAGDVDLATAPVLAGTIREAIASGSPVVVDLGAVNFIDAAGIGVMAEAADEARADGTVVVLRRPSQAVRRVMDIVALNGALPIEEDPAEPG